MRAIECVKWKAKEGVQDSQMVEAVNAMLPDLQKLDGFIEQTLYKNKEGVWVDIYYWDSVENAHFSNERMADTQSLTQLLALIDLDTVSMEVMSPIQTGAAL